MQAHAPCQHVPFLTSPLSPLLQPPQCTRPSRHKADFYLGVVESYFLPVAVTVTFVPVGP